MRSHRSLPAFAIAAALLFVGGCKAENYRTAEIDRVKAAIENDMPKLVHEAETSDPTRRDLKATFIESSIMDIRPTSSPDRPYVAHIRIRWKFDHADGKPVGYAIWDYVYALESNKWIKADEPTIVPPGPPKDDASSPIGEPSPKPA